MNKDYDYGHASVSNRLRSVAANAVQAARAAKGRNDWLSTDNDARVQENVYQLLCEILSQDEMDEQAVAVVSAKQKDSARAMKIEAALAENMARISQLT